MTVLSDINAVRGIANAASVLVGGSGTLLTRLSQAGALANSAAFLPQNIANQFTMYSTTFANMGTKLGQLFSTQSANASTAAGQQAVIQGHSAAAAGQMQAIQAGNEMIGLVNYTLQQVGTTITQMANEATTRDIVTANRQMMQDQQYQLFIADPDLPMTGSPGY